LLAASGHQRREGVMTMGSLSLNAPSEFFMYHGAKKKKKPNTKGLVHYFNAGDGTQALQVLYPCATFPSHPGWENHTRQVLKHQSGCQGRKTQGIPCPCPSAPSCPVQSLGKCSSTHGLLRRAPSSDRPASPTANRFLSESAVRRCCSVCFSF
jgi:hypothetical protein